MILEINAALAANGENIPYSEALKMLRRQLMNENIPRLVSIFDKARRACRGSGRGTAAADVVSYDVKCLRLFEDFLFPSIDVDENCPTSLYGLCYVLRMDLVYGISDVGCHLHEVLRIPEFLRAIWSLQKTYWSQLLSEMILYIL